MPTIISAATGGLSHTAADTYTIASGVTVSNATATGSRPLTLGANNGNSITLQNSGTIQSVSGSSQEGIGSSTNDNLTIVNLSGGQIQALGTGRAIRIDDNNSITNQSGATISTVNADAIKLDATNSVTNYGTIYAAAGGQAIDGDGGSNLTLYNAANAVLQAGAANVSGEDAVKIVSGTVTNYGTIIGGDEGVQGGAGANYTIVNYGTITAYDTPIASDAAATVTNYGTLTSNSDDGVDLDGTGTVTNSGTITARGSTDVQGYLGTETNEGVTMGGGTLTNSGTITSQHHGVYFVVSASSNQTQTAAGVVNNTGTITAETGYGVKFWGTAQNDTLTNSGVITAGSGTAVLMGAGDDTVTINGGRIQGSMSGEAGTDVIAFNSNFTLEGAVGAFETVSIAGGALSMGANAITGATALTIAAGAKLADHGGAIGATTFTNNGTFSVTSGVALTGNYTQSAAATLELGASLSVVGTVSIAGALTINQNASLSGVIISNDGGDAVTGTFAGLAEGAEVVSGGYLCRLSYVGGDGNDVTLTRLSKINSEVGGAGSSGAGAGGAPTQMTDAADRVLASDGPDNIALGGGADSASAGGGADTISGDLGDDTVSGGDGSDLLRGGQGADSLKGGDGADMLVGGQGADSLMGGDGADTLMGGDDADLFTGGAGADRFVVGGGDWIADFNPAEGDRIVVDAGVGYVPMTSAGQAVLAFSFTDFATFSGLSSLSADWIISL